MSCSKLSELSELNRERKNWAVCVRVSRLWHHRGASDTGPISHTDMVLLDGEGNHMYAEISTADVPNFMDKLQEGGVYEIRKFFVAAPKVAFRPVEAPYMIRFTRFTTVYQKMDIPLSFPAITYDLCEFGDIPIQSDLPPRFIDVIGSISSVSDAAEYHMASRPAPSTRREVYIRNLSGHEIKVVLWGDRATEFNGDNIRAMGQEEAVVVIFVGTLPKSYGGGRGLGGGTACRWYINEDIPDINDFRASIGDRFDSITRGDLPVQQQLAYHAHAIEDRTVDELVNLDVFDAEEQNFACTVTVTRLSPNQRWWFLSCRLCRRSSSPSGAVFACSDHMCPCDAADPRYRVCVMGTDGTEEAEFVLFGRIGEQLIGRPLMSVLRSGRSTRSTYQEVLIAAREDTRLPAAIAAVVTQKYRFIVSVTAKSILWNRPSFQVNRIDTFLGRQVHPAHPPGSHGGPSSARAPYGKKNCTPVPVALPTMPVDATPPRSVLRLAARNTEISLRKDKNILAETDDKELEPSTAADGTNKDALTEFDESDNTDPSSKDVYPNMTRARKCLFPEDKANKTDAPVEPMKTAHHPIIPKTEGKKLITEAGVSPVLQSANKRLTPSTAVEMLSSSLPKKLAPTKKSK